MSGRETVFITGANGFIGSSLCAYFLQRGFEVHGLVRSGSDLHFLEGLDVKLVYGDLLHPEEISLPPGMHYIIHSASIVSDTADEEQSRLNILQLAVNLVEKILASREAGQQLKKFIYISTALTLGFNACDIREDNPGPSGHELPYTRFKKKTEEYILRQAREKGLPAVIFRPADVYGPRDRTSCALMLKACEKGVPLIVGHGNWLFGFCYIDNLCLATYLACLKEGITGRCYTITNDHPITWKEFFSGLQRGLNRLQRIYLPVSLAYSVASLFWFIHKLVPHFKPTITHYRIKRITTHTTYDISQTITDLEYVPEKNNPRQVQSIVDWYLQEKTNGCIK